MSSPLSRVAFMAAMACMLFSFASAHMYLSTPNCIDCKEKKNSASYTMTAPLDPGGSMYPCRGPGYLGDQSLLSVQATWQAGQPQTIGFGGTVNHGGGSCQYALSYDMGKTFNVFHSQIGGCMMQGPSVQIPFPAEMPSGNNVLLGWYWQSKNAGSAESYHNCAVINVVGGGTKVLDEASYPPPFTGLMEAGNTCGYTNGNEVVYSKPGISVTYGGSYAGQKPQPGQFITGSGNCLHSGGGMKSLPATGGVSGGTVAPVPASPAGASGAAAHQGSAGTGARTPPPTGAGQSPHSGQSTPQAPYGGYAPKAPATPGGVTGPAFPAAAAPAASSGPGAASASHPGSAAAPATPPTGGLGGAAKMPCKRVRRRKRRSVEQKRALALARQRRSRQAPNYEWEEAVKRIRREEKWDEDLSQLARRSAGL